MGSSYFLAISILSFSKAFWSIVLTLPNHFLFGSTLAASVGLSCIFYLSGIFCLYIWSLLMVLVDLRELFLPSVFPLIFLSGLVDELDLLCLLNLLWRPLLFRVRAFYFLDILSYTSTINYYRSKLSILSYKVSNEISKINHGKVLYRNLKLSLLDFELNFRFAFVQSFK